MLRESTFLNIDNRIFGTTQSSGTAAFDAWAEGGEHSGRSHVGGTLTKAKEIFPNLSLVVFAGRTGEEKVSVMEFKTPIGASQSASTKSPERPLVSHAQRPKQFPY